MPACRLQSSLEDFISAHYICEHRRAKLRDGLKFTPASAVAVKVKSWSLTLVSCRFSAPLVCVLCAFAVHFFVCPDRALNRVNRKSRLLYEESTKDGPDCGRMRL